MPKDPIPEYKSCITFSMTFLFSFIGNIGILALASNIQNLAKDTRVNIKFLNKFVLFFPTLHIWTSAIGKDALTFTSINLVIFALLNIRSRFNILLFFSILIGLIRPFSGLLLFFCLTVSFLAKTNLQNYKKLLLGASTLSGIIG